MNFDVRTLYIKTSDRSIKPSVPMFPDQCLRDDSRHQLADRLRPLDPPSGTRRVGVSGMSAELLALDIDGTLLDPYGALPDAARMAVREARDAGLIIVLCTGRRYRTAIAVTTGMTDPSE